MKLRALSASVLAGLMTLACSPGKYEKTDRGVTVNVESTGENSVRKVRLQVLGEKIIRVSATPDKKFAEGNSRGTVPQKKVALIHISEATRLPGLSECALWFV